MVYLSCEFSELHPCLIYIVKLFFGFGGEVRKGRKLSADVTESRTNYNQGRMALTDFKLSCIIRKVLDVERKFSRTTFQDSPVPTVVRIMMRLCLQLYLPIL